MPHNGETNPVPGTYKTICCGAQIVMDSGAVFPDCPNHQKLTTIWKLIIEPRIAGVADLHVTNRRLFNMATGFSTLELWEQEHLHVCGLCESVLQVFMNQADPADSKDSRKSA